LELQTATAAGLANLTRLDPANRGWVLLESFNLLHEADSLLRLGRPREALERFQAALEKLRADAGQLHSSTELQRDEALGLLGIASTRFALGDHTAALAACRQAIGILQPLARIDIHNYSTQDLWIRSHLCVGEPAQVTGARQWLAQIGYRQADYVRLLSPAH